MRGLGGLQDVQFFLEFQDMRRPSVYMIGGWATEAFGLAGLE